MATEYRTLLVKRGSADDWAASTVPLQSGEWGLDQTNGVAKMGDGFNLWADLTAPLNVNAAGQLPDAVRSTLAANLGDPSTPEGAAVAEAAVGDVGGIPALVARLIAKQPLQRAVANVGTSPFDIAVVGDSNTEGAGQTSPANRWVNLMLAGLRKKHQPNGLTGGLGYVPINYRPNTLPQPWTYTLNSGVTTLALDNFNRSGSTLDGTMPDIGPSAWAGGATGYTINGADVVTAVSSSVAYLQTGSTADRSVRISVGTGSSVTGTASNPIFLYCFYKDSSNWLRVAATTFNASASTWVVQQNVAGTTTTLVSFSTAPVAAGATNIDFDISIQVSGTTVTATVNGSTVTGTITAADKAAVLSTNSGFRFALPSAFVRSYRADTVQAAPGVLTPRRDTGLGLRNMYIGPLVDCVAASMTFTGTAIDVFVTKSPATGVLSVTIDGGAAQTFNTASAAVVNGASFRVSGLTAGTHSITIAATSGYVNVEGVAVLNRDETAGVRLWESGSYGATTGNYASTLAWAGALATVQPDVVIVALGVNDYQAGVAPSSVRSNVQTILSAVRQASPTCLIVVQTSFQRGDVTNPAYPWQQYVSVLKELASINPGVLLWDTDAELGGPTVHPENSALWGGDLVHFSTAGHQAVAGSALTALAIGT